MAAIISLNGDISNQPSTLKEELKQAVHDRVSLKGTYTRVWIAQKHMAIMTFTALDQTHYNTLINYFTGSKKSVYYVNFDSGYNFVGFPTIAEASYYRGSTLLKDLNVTLVEA